jgi:DNA-binding cell septation regulator SpoVG
MNLRHKSEIEASFRRVEQMLDAMFEESHTFFEREGIRLRDSTNRTGFDGSGFPSFQWAYQFEKRTPFGSEIKVAAAVLLYREPVCKDQSPTIEVSSGAYIFQISKLSRVSEWKDEVYPIEDFLKMKMEQVIINCFAVAEQVLAKY